MPHKDQRETKTHTHTHIRLRQTKTNQQPCKRALILLLPASRHDKHNTHRKTKTQHTQLSAICLPPASFLTHRCRSDVITASSSLFLQRHRSSLLLSQGMQFNLLLRPWVLLHFPTSPPSITFHPCHPPPAHQPHYSWLDCFMLLVVVFLPRVIRHHSPHILQYKKKSMPPLSTT